MGGIDVSGLYRRQPQKPSPSGRGLGEGESPCARQRHMPPHHEKAPLSQKGGWGDWPPPSFRRRPEPRLALEWRKAGRWIYGRTVGRVSWCYPGVVMPGRGARPGAPTLYAASDIRHRGTLSSFPRKRESTPRPIATPTTAGVPDSGRRRNDGGPPALGVSFRLILDGRSGQVVIAPTPVSQRCQLDQLRRNISAQIVVVQIQRLQAVEAAQLARHIAGQ